MSRTTLLLLVAAVWAGANLFADVVTGVSSPGLTLATGFFGCALIIVVSKWLGGALLQRPERYYDDLEAAAESARRPGGSADDR